MPVSVPFPNIGIEPYMRTRNTKTWWSNKSRHAKISKLVFFIIGQRVMYSPGSSESNDVVSIGFWVGDELIWSTEGVFSNIIFLCDQLA